MIHKRRYQASDKGHLVEILRANTPRYFSAADEVEFVEYLDQRQWTINYAYLNRQSEIIGCAGCYVTDDDTINLCWALFQPGSIGFTSIPTVLTDYIATAAADLGLTQGYKVALNTTQMISKYLNRLGFSTDRIEPNGYGPGYDLVTMTRNSG